MTVHGVSDGSVGQHFLPMVDDGAISAASALPNYEQLVRAVEGEIVPRLLLARRGALPLPVQADRSQIEARDANQLARLLLLHEVDVPFAYAEAIRLRGASTRDMYIKLLAPAARQLGELWEQDECDFLQVTCGLGRLHQLLQRIGQLTPGPECLDSRGHGRRVLLATVPGETHSFGVVMVSHFFRQNGWEVFNEFPETAEDLAACVKARSFALVGLSVSIEARFEALATAVRAVRRHSRNQAVGIMVGGSIFRDHPEWAVRVGADATAEDGEQAARLAESVSALLAGEK